MIDARLAHAVAVAREGSFTKASTRIGITQPAITKSVRDLEQRLGYSLFNRSAQGALLTEQGREFVERAERMLEDARELMTGSLSTDPYAGVLRVGVCPASIEWLLAAPLADLLRRHPSIRLEITGGKFESMAQLLLAGSVDVAVGFDAAFREWPDLARHPVDDFLATLFVRNGHPLLALDQIETSDLSGYEFIAPSDSRPYGQRIREIYEANGKDWRRYLHVIDYFPIVCRLVASTDAIGTIAVNTTTKASFSDRFKVLESIDFLPKVKMSCATRGRWLPKPATKAFINTMARFRNATI